jgi:hypothetical protein
MVQAFNGKDLSCSVAYLAECTGWQRGFGRLARGSQIFEFLETELPALPRRPEI